MTAFSISRAWEETIAFVRAEAALLFPVAFALLGPPAVVLDLVMPATPPVAGQYQPWMILLIPYLVIMLFASMTLSRLALGSAVSVGEALGDAARRLPVAIGASLLLAGMLVLAIVPIVPVLGMSSAAAQGMNPGVALLTLAYTIAIAPVMFYISVRLLLLNPELAVGCGGPIATLRRAWALTRGRFWPLFGFFLSFLIVSSIASVAISSAVGSLLLLLGRLIGRPAVGAVLVALLSGALNATFSIFLSTMIARLYRQLTGSNNGT